MLSRRSWAGDADLAAMIALARIGPDENLHVTDLPYRFSSWALDEPDNVALWADRNGELVAWAAMQTPLWAIDYVLHPRAERELHRQVLAWADWRARALLDTPFGRPMWFVNVFPEQKARIRELEDAGYACQADVGENSWSKVWMKRPGAAPLPASVRPEGFTIRPLAGEGEVEAYVALHRAVFGSENMTVEWRARTLLRPEYRTDLDLVAVGPDGRLAAFCVGWLEPGMARGQVEPMGVDAAFRDRGLGRAILSESLRRLYHAGAREVGVETDLDRDAALGLYETMGFRTERDVLVYRADYDKTRG